MPVKKPRNPVLKAPLPFREAYGQRKAAEREVRELRRKLAILGRAEKYPDLRDEIMSVYDKPARKTTLRQREAMLANAPPEVAALSRRLSESAKKRPRPPHEK